MKYVIFEGNGLVHPVLFGDHTTHSQISIAGAKPVSAGFVKFNSIGWPKCFGMSESLHLESRGELDEDIIRRAKDNACTAMFLIEWNQPDSSDSSDSCSTSEGEPKQLNLFDNP